MQNQLMQFLLGLSEEYVITRGIILMINSLCPIYLPCYKLLQAEIQIEICSSPLNHLALLIEKGEKSQMSK